MRRSRRKEGEEKKEIRPISTFPPLTLLFFQPSKKKKKLQQLTNFLLGEYDGADHLVAASEAAAVSLVAPVGAERKRKLEGGEGGTATEASAAAAALAPAAAAAEQRPPSPSSPLDPLAVTRSLELSLRDRNSQMLAGGGFDFSAVLEQADKAAAAEKAARARGGGGGAPSSTSSRTPHAAASGSTLGQIAALPSRRFERDRATAAGAGEAGGAGGAGASLPGGGGGAPVEGLEEFDELGFRPTYGARDTKAAQAAEAKAAASAAAEAKRRWAEEAARRAAAGSTAAKRKAGGPSSSAAAAAASKAEAAGISSGLPIIVVPAAATARLNMLNAPAFFASGAFEHPDALRAAGAKKSPSAVIVREVAREAEAGSSQGAPSPAAAAAGGAGDGAASPARYFVTDRTDAFRSLDWSRVVAVVVSGAAWQFKGWPFRGLESGSTVDLFSKVAGVFVGYAGEEPPAAVKTWNVTRHGLHREARHRDRSVASAVWRAIDAMGASRRARALG